MPGVRLHHPELRNCTFTIIHFGRPLTHEMLCPVCKLLHTHKTYHLALDALGDVVVSEVIYARLKDADLGELIATKEIAKPEPLRVDLGAAPPTNVVSREGVTS